MAKVHMKRMSLAQKSLFQHESGFSMGVENSGFLFSDTLDNSKYSLIHLITNFVPVFLVPTVRLLFGKNVYELLMVFYYISYKSINFIVMYNKINE